MPIIFRGSQDELEKDPTWDKNTTEMSLVEDARVKTVATAICGIVPRNRLDAQGGFATPMGKLEENIRELLKMEQTKLINVLTQVAEVATKMARISELEARTALDKAKGTSQEASKNADLMLAQSRLEKAQKYGQIMAKKLQDFDWPLKGNSKLSLKTRFLQQPTVAAGTGFMFATGYVMTAAHCIPKGEQWPQYKVCLNAQSVVAKAAVDGGYSSRVEGGLHLIVRVVLRSKDESTKGTVNDIYSHDVGILELFDKENNAFRATPLIISDNPPAVSDPVYLIGHPHNVPLKYTRVPLGSTEVPKVLATPDDPCTCLTADIDKFPGNSGGPLLNLETNEVIGLVRATGQLPLDAVAPKSTLWSEIDKWQKQISNDTGINKGGATEADVAAMFAPFRRNPAPNFFSSPFFTYAPLRLGNQAHMELIKTKNLFNRVDMYSGFCKPLQNFLKIPSRGFRVEMTIYFDPDGLNQPPTWVQPKIDMGKNSYRCSTLRKFETFGLDDMSYRVFKGTWVRQVETKEDLTFVPANDSNNSIDSGLDLDFPDDVFQATSGMCAWRGVQVNTAQAFSGRIEVTYAFDVDKVFQFAVELEFERSTKTNIRYATLGETRRVTGQPVGKAWDAPTSGKFGLKLRGSKKDEELEMKAMIVGIDQVLESNSP